MRCAEFYRAESLADALRLMEYNSNRAVVIAGGTDIVPKSRTRNWYEKKVLVDISGVGELRGISEDEQTITIGAVTSLTDVADSALVNRYIPLLAKACGSVGGPQVRNRGTIGGNVVNACPAGDCIPALMALEATVTLRKGATVRKMPIAKFFQENRACLKHGTMSVRGCYFGDPALKKTMMEPGELLTGITVPKLPPGARVCFHKVAVREALCMSRFTLAVVLAQDEQKRLTHFRLSIGAVFPKPPDFSELSAELLGRYPSREDITAYADALAELVKADCGDSPDAAYKYTVCRRLCKRTLLELIRGETDG